MRVPSFKEMYLLLLHFYSNIQTRLIVIFLYFEDNKCNLDYTYTYLLLHLYNRYIHKSIQSIHLYIQTSIHLYKLIYTSILLYICEVFQIVYFRIQRSFLVSLTVSHSTHTHRIYTHKNIPISHHNNIVDIIIIII